MSIIRRRLRWLPREVMCLVTDPLPKVRSCQWASPAPMPWPPGKLSRGSRVMTVRSFPRGCCRADAAAGSESAHPMRMRVALSTVAPLAIDPATAPGELPVGAASVATVLRTELPLNARLASGVVSGVVERRDLGRARQYRASIRRR